MQYAKSYKGLLLDTYYMNKTKDVTIYDIAQALKISPATVSRGLKNHAGVNKETKKRIAETARKMGYRSNTFASNLRRQHTNTIGVIIHELKSHFITSVLAGIEKITTQANYDLIIGHSSETMEKEVANVMNLFHKRVDGLIASLSFDTDDLSHFDPFFKKGLPVVFFDRVEEQLDMGTKVIIDNFKAGYQATRHLVEQGCTRIAHVTASLKRNVYAERLRGYKAAIEEQGIPYDPDLLIVNGLSEQDSVEAARKIMHMQPVPDGLFITNDLCAAVCMQTLKEAGISIPRDIAVVGFNNDVIANIIEPKLTTIDYPGKAVGEIAARNLVAHLSGDTNISLTNTIIINSELIVRESSLKSANGK